MAWPKAAERSARFCSPWSRFSPSTLGFTAISADNGLKARPATPAWRCFGRRSRWSPVEYLPTEGHRAAIALWVVDAALIVAAATGSRARDRAATKRFGVAADANDLLPPDLRPATPPMAILGIGTDIVECPRIADMIERHQDIFITRVYTDRGDRILQRPQGIHAALRRPLGRQGSGAQSARHRLAPRHQLARHRDRQQPPGRAAVPCCTAAPAKCKSEPASSGCT